MHVVVCLSGQFLNDVGRHADGAVSYVTASQLSPDDFELVFNTASALRSHINSLSTHIKQESLANAKVNARQHCVNEMPITDYVLEYNNFSLWDEDSENIASERYENRHLRRPLSCLTPHISRTPANICITLISLESTFTGLHFHC